MKKLISLLSLTLVFTLLLCTLVGCGQKSNMRDLVKALKAESVDKSLVDVTQTNGSTDNGTVDYSHYQYELKGYDDGNYESDSKMSASLRQTIRSLEITAGSAAQEHEDFGRFEKEAYLAWYFDPTVGETGDFIRGWIVYSSNNVADKPDIYFKVSFKVYDIEFFTENVNSTEGFLDAEDLKKFEISEYSADSEATSLEALSPEHLVIFIEMFDEALATLVKTCADAGYPVVIPEK